MAVLVRHYLRVEPDQDFELFLEQYAEALWMEKRQVQAMASAVAKGFGGDKK